MKKITHILFVALFTTITVGITVNKHYSGGELFSFAIFSEPESCCAEACNCCDEKTETIQFLADYTFSTDTFEPVQVELQLFAIASPLIITEATPAISATGLTDQDLPPPAGNTTFFFTQSFLL